LPLEQHNVQISLNCGDLDGSGQLSYTKRLATKQNSASLNPRAAVADGADPRRAHKRAISVCALEVRPHL
jgi:hypothetical protein